MVYQSWGAMVIDIVDKNMLMLAEEIHGVNIANRTFKVVMVFEILI
jgi:hypothetical protein